MHKATKTTERLRKCFKTASVISFDTKVTIPWKFETFIKNKKEEAGHMARLLKYREKLDCYYLK